MSNRRDFFRNALAATAGAALSGCVPNNHKAIRTSNPASTKGRPVVIATWNNVVATETAMKTLMEGGSALDAAEAGARIPEADPNDISVGYGGLPDRDGNVTLDACVMDDKGNTGAVCFLKNIKHPVSVARKVMENTPHNMICGSGALEFALSQGFVEENLLTEGSRKAWQEWLKEKNYKPVINIERHDTIGILAMDKSGNLSGACTTSGLAFKMSGRIGDSPIIGAGLFIDNEIGGACATGLGELMTQTLGSFLIVELMRMGYSPQAACEEAVNRIIRRAKAAGISDYQAGFLALDKSGEHGAYSVVQGFSYALYQNDKNIILEAGHKL
jgi:N4-(beta-N-acetylglucosaminyl)-L-asparaginase